MASITKELTRLTPKQRRYVKERAKGKPAKLAAIDAGYALSTARKGISQIENADVKAIFADLVRRACSPPKLAQRIAEGLDAMKTEFFAKDGRVLEQKDTVAWSERRAYIELAAEYAGYVSPNESQSTNLHILTSLPATCNQPIDLSVRSGPVGSSVQSVEQPAIEQPADASPPSTPVLPD